MEFVVCRYGWKWMDRGGSKIWMEVEVEVVDGVVLQLNLVITQYQEGLTKQFNLYGVTTR